MRILMVEDDQALCAAVDIHLRQQGYTVDYAHTGEDGLHFALQNAYDLILMDRMLPELDGLEAVRTLRSRGFSTPVLMLTALDGVPDRVDGLDAGADDYLVKPFDVEEFKARVRALLRRSQGRAQPLLEHAGIRLDPANQQVHYQDNEVVLTPMEYQLLHQLMVRPGKVVTRERLSRALYGWQDRVESNTLEVLIHNLRKKLCSELIRTVRGVGYVLALKP